MKRLALVLAFTSAVSGCDNTLDSFLYRRTQVDQYTITPEGEIPQETVAPERIELVTIKVDDEVSLGAVYIKANVQPPRGYLLYFHGQGTNLDGHSNRMKWTANLGYDTLGFDYRGWGTSTDVTPTEPGILEDSKATLAYFAQRTGVQPGEMIFYGRSFGAAVATQLAVESNPGVLILESPFSSVEEFKQNSSRMDFPSAWISNGEWDNVARIKEVEAPVLLLHGLADDFVRPEFSEQIYAVANDPKKLVLVEGADHGDVPDRMSPEEYARVIHEWVETHLR
ncbi:MAG: alpha/beta hydrolase [Myxococcaceae bacterium]